MPTVDELAAQLAALQSQVRQALDVALRHHDRHRDRGGDPLDQKSTRGHTHDQIVDADADTSVEVERTADDDVIRLKAGGTDAGQVQAGGFGVAGWQRVGSLVVPTITTAGDLTVERINIGNAAFVAGTQRMQFLETYTPTQLFSNYIRVQPTLNPGAGVGLWAGLQLTATVSPTAATGIFNAGRYIVEHNAGAFDISMLVGSVYTAVQNLAGTTVTNLFGARMQYQALAGIATTAIGVDVIRGSGGDVGSIGTGIGLRIAASAGVTPTTDIAIQSLGGHHRFVGAVTIGANTTPTTSAALDLAGVTGALLINRLTTAQRDALTPANGMVIYNTSLGKFQVYEAGAWANMVHAQAHDHSASGDGQTLAPLIMRLPTPTVLTISGGIVPYSQRLHKIDTEGGAALDFLDKMTGGTGNDTVILAQNAAARDIYIPHLAGGVTTDTFFLRDGYPVLLDVEDKFICFLRSAMWIELWRNFPYARPASISLLAPAANDEITLPYYGEALRIVSGRAWVRGAGTSCTIDLRAGTDRSAAGTALLSGTTAVVTNKTTGQALSFVTNPNLPVGGTLWLKAPAVVGAIDEVILNLMLIHGNVTVP